MNSELEEDYEISNIVNRAQFEEANLNSKKLNESEPQDFYINQREKASQFYILSYFVNQKNFAQLLDKNNTEIFKIVNKFDKTLIIDDFMNFLEKISESKLKSYLVFKDFFLPIFILFLFICLSLKISIYYIPFFILFFSLSIYLYFKFFEIFFIYLISLLQNYLVISKKIIYFLKEIELVSLASKRRYFIENNPNAINTVIDQDNINYPYRKYIFKLMRNHFFGLKRLNENLLAFSPKLTSKSNNFICTLKANDLSEIMWNQKEDSHLEVLTDFYSIDCIKSVMKLNLLLVSENLKTVLKIFFELILTESNVLNLYILLIRFSIKLVLEAFKIKNLNKNLENGLELMNLPVENEEKLQSSKNSTSLEHNLRLYLRNAFLSASALTDISEKDFSMKKETINLLKYNVEHVNLYLKQLICNVEGEHSQTIINKIDLNVSSNSQSSNIVNENVNSLDSTIAPIEDEIFEADTNNLIEIESKKQDLDFDSENFLKEKENQLANKNLFYELKYALKTKKNEWREREKIAKKTTDENSKCTNENPLTFKDDFDGFHFNVNHLLENDALKYKSELRKRRTCLKNAVETETNEKRFKYKYEEFCDDSESQFESKEAFFKPSIDSNNQNRSVINEFMMKRNLLLNRPSNEEETLFE